MSAATESRPVLVAIDGSAQAEAAFDWFMSNLYRPEHRLILMHSVDPPYVKADQGTCFPAEVWSSMLASEKEKAQKLENKFSEKLRSLGIPGSVRVLFHINPGEAIVDEATKEKVTLIVTGTRGLGTFRRTILGSVSDYVVHHAPCPVLVCRPSQ